MALLLAAALALLAPAGAQLASILRDPSGPAEPALWFSPVAYSHALDGPAFGAASGWYVTQWSALQQLNASDAVAGAGPCPDDAGWSTVWHAAAAGQLICLQRAAGGGGLGYFVAQDGSAVAPGGGVLPCGAEFDSFLSPTDRAYANVPALNLNTSASLGDWAELVVRFSAELTALATTPRCGSAGSCGPSGHLDYGYVTLGLVLGALPGASGSASTLFYQADLADTRGVPSCPANDPCTTAFAGWFETGPATLGFGASAAALGIPCLRPGAGPVAYELPVLAWLNATLADAAARFGADGDPAHWRLVGLYLGPGLEGSTVTGFRAWGIDALAAPRAR